MLNVVHIGSLEWVTVISCGIEVLESETNSEITCLKVT
jgi:hypothetical protein